MDPNFGQDKTLIIGLSENTNSDILNHFSFLSWSSVT